MRKATTGGASWPLQGSRFSLWPIDTQPEVLGRLSGLKRMPTETSCIPFTDCGQTTPPVSTFHRWSYLKNFRCSCPGHVSTSSAMRGVWRHIARFEMQSSHTAATGCGRRGNEAENPLLEGARLLGWVFDLDMATYPFYRRGSL